MYQVNLPDIVTYNDIFIHVRETGFSEHNIKQP